MSTSASATPKPARTPHLTAAKFQSGLAALAAELRRHIEAECPEFPSDPAAAAERARRTSADDGFRFFCQTYFPHYLTAAPSVLHEFLFEALPALVADPRGRRLALAAPRGEAKSTLAALLFPLWCAITERKRYIVLIMDALDQALPALEALKAELDSNPRLRADFPDAVGEGRIWQQRVILTAKDVKIEVFGSGKRMRGLRHGPHRPDFIICHEKGTPILHEGEWIKVEEHPTAVERQASGLAVRVWGLPFAEKVTPEHRYFVKSVVGKRNQRDTIKRGLPKWAEAQSLTTDYFIGYPIDFSVEAMHPVACLNRRKTRAAQDEKTGRIVGSSSCFDDEIPPEFADPEWWWFFGLWWGDGYSSGRYAINITIANKDESTVFCRLASLLERYKIAFWRESRDGCFQVFFSHAVLSRWLKSWHVAPSRKQPPAWVEKIDFEHQKALVQGYVAADGFIDHASKAVRITSIHLDGLLCLRRILARLGIPASVRDGIDGKDSMEICGRECKTQKKYDLRFRNNCSLLGYPFANQQRYGLEKIFIEDGYLWSKIRSVDHSESSTFVPIRTSNHTYLTHFGLSHNCDDCENDDNVRNPAQRDKLDGWLRKTVLQLGPADGSADVFVIGTVLHYDSVLSRLLKNPLWETHRFRALIRWPDRMDLWERWEEVLRAEGEEAARRHYLQSQALMDAGAAVSWPAQRPLYALMVQRARDGHAAFDAELQNDPVDQAEAWFGGLRFWSEPNPDWLFFGACDPSLGKAGTGRDPSAVLIGGYDRKTGVLDVIEARILRRPPDQLIEDIIDLQARYRCLSWAVEAVQFQEFFRAELVKRSAARGIPVPARPLLPRADKRLRIESLQPHVANGLIRVHASQTTLIEQLRHYPAADHDDGPDALHMLWTLALASGPAFAYLPSAGRARWRGAW